MFGQPSVVIQSPWQSWASERWEPSVGCLSSSLFVSSPVCLYGCSLFLFFFSSLSVLCPKCGEYNFTLFVHTSLPVRSCIPIPPSRTLLSPLCATLSVERQACSRVMESWPSRLLYGVPGWQTYQSHASFLPVRDDNASALPV